MKFVEDSITVRVSNKQKNQIDELAMLYELNRSRMVRKLIDEAWENYNNNV